jgi:hypothetical protein
MAMKRRKAVWLVVLVLLGGCVSAQVISLGPDTSYPPVPVSEVQVFLTEADVPGPFEKLALIKLSGDVDYTNDIKMVNKAKAEAAKIGANGIILGETKEPSAGAKIAGEIFGVPSERKGQVVAIRFTASDLGRERPSADR